MEAIIFCGIQASGKTSFYKEHFFSTHIRISLDMLHTRNKENIFLQTCLLTQQRFVVDNTNLTKTERRRYIEKAIAYKFRATAYYFHTGLQEAIERNNNRKGKECIPEKGIRGSFRKLEPPGFAEGFDRIYAVEIIDNHFALNQWQPG